MPLHDTLRKVENQLKKAPGLAKLVECTCQIVCGIPFLLYCTYTERRVAKRRTKDREKEASYRFPPPISKRGRALSVRLSEDERKLGVGRVVRRKTIGQGESGLFRLPFDLREQIYRTYFQEGEEIAVLFGRGILRSFVAQREELQDARAVSGKWGVKRRPDVLGLLLTCRNVYTEAVSYMYSCPTFFFINNMSFIAFSHSILPSRFKSIHRVRIQCLDSDLPREVMMNKEQDMRSCYLEGAMTYRDMYLKNLRGFYGSPSCAQSRNSDTFWKATCRALASAESLMSLDILVRKPDTQFNEDITKPLEEQLFVQLQNFVLGLVDKGNGARGWWMDVWQVEEWRMVVENGILRGWDNNSHAIGSDNHEHT